MSDGAAKKWSASSLAMLLSANLIPIIGVVWLQWTPLSVVLLYVAETAAIGVIAMVKIATAGTGAQGARWMLVPFFCVHFGFFIAIQTLFVFVLIGAGGEEAAAMAQASWMAGVFLISHAYSMMVHWFRGGERKAADPRREMFKPYSRVFIQQVVVIGGANLMMMAGMDSMIFVILLVAAKTAIDATTHVMRHRHPAP